MSGKTVNLILMVGGAVLMVLSLGADVIGIGSYPGFNSSQLAGTVAGLAALGFGYWRSRSSGKVKK